MWNSSFHVVVHGLCAFTLAGSRFTGSVIAVDWRIWGRAAVLTQVVNTAVTQSYRVLLTSGPWHTAQRPLLTRMCYSCLFIFYLHKNSNRLQICVLFFLSQNYKSHDISMAAAALMVNIQTFSPTPRLPCGSELHQVCVGSVGVQFQHLSVPISPVFHFSSALSWSSSRQLLLTQRDEAAVQPQPIVLADVVVVLHSSAFGLPAQRGLRDDQHAARELQHRHHLPWVGLTQPYIQQSGHWGDNV